MLYRLSSFRAVCQVLALALLGLASSAGDGQLPLAEEEGAPLPVSSLEVHEEDSYTVKRFYSGRVSPRRSSELGFPVGGHVVEVTALEGNRVHAGQELASLSTAKLEARGKELDARKAQAAAQLDEMVSGPRLEAIRAARAQVNDFTEQLSLLRIKRNRTARLLEQDAVAQDAFDEAVSGQKQLEARLDAARNQLDELVSGTRDERIRGQQSLIDQLDANLELLSIEIAESTIRAPYAGTISRRYVDEGTIVSAGQPVLRIVEDGFPEARIGVPVERADGIAVGTSFPLQLGGKNLWAKVRAVLPEVEPLTRTVQVILTIEHESFSIVAGDTIQMAMNQEVTERGIWIPMTALTQGVRGLWAVYALIQTDRNYGGEPTYRVEQRPIEILHGDNEGVFVTGTLKDGDWIIASGAHRVVVGQIVRPSQHETSLDRNKNSTENQSPI